MHSFLAPLYELEKVSVSRAVPLRVTIETSVIAKCQLLYMGCPRRKERKQNKNIIFHFQKCQRPLTRECLLTGTCRYRVGLGGKKRSFAKCSAANHLSVHDQSRQDLSKAIIWNNKFIKRDFLKHKTIKVRDNKLNRRFGVDITPLSR